MSSEGKRLIDSLLLKFVGIIDDEESVEFDVLESYCTMWNTLIAQIKEYIEDNPTDYVAYDYLRKNDGPYKRGLERLKSLEIPHMGEEGLPTIETLYTERVIVMRIVDTLDDLKPENLFGGEAGFEEVWNSGSWPRVNGGFKTWNKAIESIEQTVSSLEFNLVNKVDRFLLEDALTSKAWLETKTWVDNLYRYAVSQLGGKTEKLCKPKSDLSIMILLGKDQYKGKKNLLLIIDAQKDFVEVGGKLFVMGAPAGMKNLIQFIDLNRELLSDIFLTMDDHYNTHIGMPHAWLEGNPKRIINNYPITISKKEVEDGRYEPRFLPRAQVLEYLERIEERGETHHIWPEHCIHGSVGQQFPDELIDSLKWWSEEHNGKHYVTIHKGNRDEAEMYSAFSYADGSCPEYTQGILNRIYEGKYDNIFVAGFAKDYCVRCTLQDFFKDSRFREKLVILDSCMAAINTIDKKTEKLWTDLELEFGAKIIK